MALLNYRNIAGLCILLLVVASCGRVGAGFGSIGGKLFGAAPATVSADNMTPQNATAGTPPPAQQIWAPLPQKRGWFRGGNKKAAQGEVNKFIWTAALEVLNFLPVQSANPYSGVIETGYGTPPGGGRAYRATIMVQGGTLDAGSLRVILRARSGAISAATTTAIENAILSRARLLSATRTGNTGNTGT